MPGPRPRRHEIKEENYFFSSASTSSACSTSTAATPTSSARRRGATRPSGSSGAACATSPSPAPPSRGPCPCPGTAATFYVWYDALTNYLTVAGSGGDPAVFEPRWGSSHHLIGKDILRFHCVWWPAMCMAPGLEPPDEIFVHGYLLMGGQKLGKTMIASGRAGGEAPAPLKITDVRPRPADDFGVDPLRYYLLREWRSAATATSPTRARSALQRRPRQQSRQPGVAVTTVVTSKCGGIGPGCNPASELAAVAAAVLEAATAAWARWAPHEALEETWRLIGAANAELESAEPWKMEPGPGRRCRPGRRARSAADRRRPHCAGHAVDRRRGLVINGSLSVGR